MPGSTVVGEEGGRQGEGRVVWYVDPIDGTTNFARGLPTWCVSIAAEVDGEIVAGVVHAPVTGETFRADLVGRVARRHAADRRRPGPRARRRCC